MQQFLLTILLLLPTVGAIASIAHGLVYKRETDYRWIALAFSVVTFLLSILLLGDGGAAKDGFRFVQDVSWINAVNARYHIGVDGISLWLVLLTTLLVPVSILSSWTSVTKRTLSFYVFILSLETAMIGVFVSLDLLLFYLFFEATLVPMFFLIGIWGGKNRIYAAVKFFIFTALGSLLMLVAIIALYYIYADQTGLAGSFDFVTILGAMKAGTLVLPPQTGMALF